MRSLLLTAAVLALAACARAPEGALKADTEAVAAGDAAKGRELFVQKGCVLCHSINGVGGKAGPALDVADDFVKPDPLGFAARMWRGAPAMVEFQSLELGYVIDLMGEDIGNLAAFAASRSEQKKLLDSAIPDPMRSSILDERFWETEDWSEFLKNGQEGYGDPEPPTGATPDAPTPDPDR
ncbi:MAG: c-type cytochrome [Parvularculaceae bacterium]